MNLCVEGLQPNVEIAEKGKCRNVRKLHFNCSFLVVMPRSICATFSYLLLHRKTNKTIELLKVKLSFHCLMNLDEICCLFEELTNRY